MKINDKLGIVQFECDRDSNGKELDNYSQRNNEIIWPPNETHPKAQYRTSFKNVCNTTSYVMALLYAGYKFPSGKYKQPEDNLAYFILTDERIRSEYKKRQPAMYDLFIKSLEGKCTENELKNMYFPNELHDYLCLGANKWIGTEAAKFSTTIDFKKALWKYFVNGNLPMVISTNFGGYGHIVVVTGVQFSTETYNKIKETQDFSLEPLSIIIDDPWGKYNYKTDKYDAPNNGNDIIIPWDIVVKRVKPYNSSTVKWAHTFNHSVATI